MNVPRDYESLFNNAVNNITVLIDWAPNEAAKNQLTYALCGLKAGYRIATTGFASLKVEPPRPAVNLWPQEDAQRRENIPDGLYTEGKPNPLQYGKPPQQFMFCGTYVNTGCEQPITCECLCCAKHCTCVKKVEPPKGANPVNPEKVSKTLDFLGRWKTRGGYFVEITGRNEVGEWAGHYTDRQGMILFWDDEGKNTDSELDLMDRLREAPKFANG